MFLPHRNLSERVNRNIVRSEIEGGVYLKDLPDAAMLEVETSNRAYRLTVYSDGSAWISGHPDYCPEPVLVQINGCNWGGSMLKIAYLGRGMHLEFRHPEYEGSIITSPIQDIRLLAA
jgi:hypothetical protein